MSWGFRSYACAGSLPWSWRIVGALQEGAKGIICRQSVICNIFVFFVSGNIHWHNLHGGDEFGRWHHFNSGKWQRFQWPRRRLALWTLRRGWPCQAQCLNFYKLWDYKIIIWFVFVHIVYTLYTIIISYFYRYGFVMCAFLNEIRTGIKTCLLVLVLKLMVQLERVDKTTKWLTYANVAGGLCVHCLEMHTTVFYWLDGSDNPCKGSVILSFGQPASDLCSTAGRWDLFASNASGAVSQLACELEGVNKKVLAQTWLVWHEGF